MTEWDVEPSIAALLRAYKFNLKYAQQLIRDLPDDAAFTSGGPGLENHPGFVIGHLVTGAGLAAAGFNGHNTVDPQVRMVFERKGPNDERLPINEESKFSLSELSQMLIVQHDIVSAEIENCSREKWMRPKAWRLGEYFPTFFDACWFLCVTHESLHLGQLAAWRRWYGLPSAMAQL